jgi:hypothetical protein
VGIRYLIKERFHLPRRSEGHKNPSNSTACKCPHMRNVSWRKDRITGFEEESILKQIQEQLWEFPVEVTKTDRSAVAIAYLSSLNQVFDLHEKHIASFENRVPLSVWLVIFSVSSIAVFTRGLMLGDVSG